MSEGMLDPYHEALLREFLWWNHGHRDEALYGDDGELQCRVCGHWDYLRDQIPILIEQAVGHATVRDLRAAAERLKP